MKPRSKKAIVWAVAIALVALIAWLVFFRKKKWEAVLEKLDIDATVKEQIRAMCAQLDSDPAQRQAIEAESADYGETYARWLVMTAAMKLKYPVQTNPFGQIIINPKN